VYWTLKRGTDKFTDSRNTDNKQVLPTPLDYCSDPQHSEVSAIRPKLRWPNSIHNAVFQCTMEIDAGNEQRPSMKDLFRAARESSVGEVEALLLLPSIEINSKDESESEDMDIDGSRTGKLLYNGQHTAEGTMWWMYY
jgi:hypothetical protein